METHTKELDIDGEVPASGIITISAKGDILIAAHVICYTDDGVPTDEDRKFAKRLVDSFNACADIPNPAAVKEMRDALEKRINNAEQKACDEWFSKESPSGDHESTMRQWQESSDYSDFEEEWSDVRQALARAKEVAV